MNEELMNTMRKRRKHAHTAWSTVMPASHIHDWVPIQRGTWRCSGCGNYRHET